MFSFDMKWYPFDVQECHLDFKSEEVSAKFVELIPGELKYTGKRELDQYYIRGYPDDPDDEPVLLSDKSSGETVIKVKLKFGRRLLSIILTVYFTTFIFNLVGHTSAIYRDFYFEAQVTLNVTVMLVQVTMFTSVSIKRAYSD